MTRATLVVLLAAFCAACDSNGGGSTPTAPTPITAEMCDVEGELRSKTLFGFAYAADVAQWNARLTCRGGTPGYEGRVRFRFGAQLLVNGVERSRRYRNGNLESGDSHWLCGDALTSELTGWCGWPGGDGDLPIGTTWSWRGYWTWCLDSQNTVLNPCPDEPIDD